ncbi:MAG: transketolase [Armatimonadetes bacterium]|nr:transketolase [Armatimonadota bacterium]
MANPFNLSIHDLRRKAYQLRKDIIVMLTKAGSGHPGGSLSAIDIITALYYRVMNHDPSNPQWPERDRFLLSKGHACPALYAVLADTGYFPREWLWRLRKIDGHLEGHPSRVDTPGVEMSAGPLGQGLAVANGIALAGRLDKRNYRVFVMLGDGECDEGEVWEAAMAAAHYKLDRVVGILDYNGLQIDGPNEKVMSLGDIAAKWRAFGWHVVEIDGHNMQQIVDTLSTAGLDDDGEPTMVIARTVKGKGVSFMENVVDWHGKAPNEQEMEQALRELEEAERALGVG